MDDYTPTVKNAIITKVAEDVDVPVTAISLTVTPASVRLLFIIAMASAELAKSTATLLVAKMNTTAAASAYLSTPTFNVNVESIAMLPMYMEVSADLAPKQPTNTTNKTALSPPTPPPPPSSPMEVPTISAAISLIQASETARRRLDLALSHGRNLAAPTQGAYVTDDDTTYLEDETTYIYSTPSMILCLLAGTSPHLKLNQGTYLSFVDQTKCMSRGGIVRQHRLCPCTISACVLYASTQYGVGMVLGRTCLSAQILARSSTCASVNATSTQAPMATYAEYTGIGRPAAPSGCAAYRRLDQFTQWAEKSVWGTSAHRQAAHGHGANGDGSDRAADIQFD